MAYQSVMGLEFDTCVVQTVGGSEQQPQFVSTTGELNRTSKALTTQMHHG